MGVNPSLIINKGIYIQHVDGGLYTKENWSNKGYVGGAGEFFLISLYANEINECLLMVGGTIMSNKMWTSTQSTQFTYSWYYDINIQGDHLDTSTRSNPRYVRPFTELIL